VVLLHQAFFRALGGAVAVALVLLLIMGALASRHRREVAALSFGALGALALVCLNATARFQNYRYAAPILAMVLCAALLGIDALALRTRFVAALAGLLLLWLPHDQWWRQRDHFARASANIAAQHVEVARRLRARSPRPRRVLVSDAGAIPYLSEIPAVDGLGLGGFRALPFARASLHGEGAVIELIERIEPAERPDVMALYPEWWRYLVSTFGTREDGVRIVDNVICGGPEKVIYRADWSALALPGESPPGAIDGLDVADLVDERAHGYQPGRDAFVVAEVLHSALAGGRRFDAGRRVGAALSFELRAGIAPGPARLVARGDGVGEATVVVTRDGREVSAVALVFGPRPEGAWNEVEVALGEVAGGDRIVLLPDAPLSLHRLWLVR
jgi:hypothetical protein